MKRARPFSVWLCCLAGAVLTRGFVVPVSAEPAELTIQVDVSAIGVAAGAAGSTVFSCPGAQWLGVTGEPRIPWRVMTVLLPPDATLETMSVRLDGARYEVIAGTWTIGPVPPVATWHDDRQVIVWPADKVIVDGRDAAVYGTDGFWPAVDVRLLDTGRLRKWRLAQVAVPLLKLNPVQGALRRLTDGKVVVSFKRAASAAVGAATRSELADAIGEETIQRIAVNYPQQRAAYESSTDPVIENGAAPAAGGSKPGYVVITTSAIQSASAKLADFVAHKQLCGFDVQVITEADFGGGLGDTAAENIRAWLQAHYLSDNLLYVLLIGNPHPSGTDPNLAVPMKMLWPRHGASEYEESPSDYYYADLTGNWDLDGDGFYGEGGDDFGPGGVDRNWEVLVGRIPYYGVLTDWDDILTKIIDYEQAASDVTAWRRAVLLPMEPSDESTPGYHLGEQIKGDVILPAGWLYHRVYEEDYGLVPPPETTPCTKSNVTNAWTSRGFGLVVWWTHGSSISAADVMDILYARNLNDDYPAFTFQVSCHNSYPESGNLSYALLDNGAVATIGATRVSWYYPGQTNFAGSTSNAGMSYEYATRIVNQGVSCGQALHEVKQVLTPGIWMNFTVFNIYGDPSTCIVPFGYTLSLEVDGKGSIQVDPNLPDYPPGVTVTLTAEPNDGKVFRKWKLYDPNHPNDANHLVIDANNPVTIVMNADRQVKAIFKCASGEMAPPLLMTIGLLGVLRLRRGRRIA